MYGWSHCECASVQKPDCLVANMMAISCNTWHIRPITSSFHSNAYGCEALDVLCDACVQNTCSSLQLFPMLSPLTITVCHKLALWRSSYILLSLQKTNCYFDNTSIVTKIVPCTVLQLYRGSTYMPKTDESIELYSMHSYILEKEKKVKNNVSSLPPSMEGQTYLTLGKKRRK